MQYAESYPRAQAPKRIPLTFTKGTCIYIMIVFFSLLLIVNKLVSPAY